MRLKKEMKQKYVTKEKVNIGKKKLDKDKDAVLKKNIQLKITKKNKEKI